MNFLITMSNYMYCATDICMFVCLVLEALHPERHPKHTMYIKNPIYL
jgi:hypothetical protein